MLPIFILQKNPFSSHIFYTQIEAPAVCLLAFAVTMPSNTLVKTWSVCTRNESGIFDCDCWRFINVRKLKDEVCDICLHSAKSHVVDIVPGQTRLNQEMELVTPTNESINWSCKVCEETHQVRFK